MQEKSNPRKPMAAFIENDEFVKYRTQARKIWKLVKTGDRYYSDVIDEEGHQYVDLVQEGGGVLGIALVGYTMIMEEAGIRFYNLAGTSAGTINTAMIASCRNAENISEPVSQKVLEEVLKQNLFDFVDGPFYIKWCINRLIKGPFWSAALLILLFFLPIAIRLAIKRGLNPGKVFEKWVEDTMKNHGIKSIQEIDERCRLLHQHVSKGKNKVNISRIVMIASDITTSTKVEFPRLSSLYWDDSMVQPHPAKMVRASMSVPFFFDPLIIEGTMHEQGKENSEKWKEKAAYYGKVPEKIYMVDGGLLSNFPINSFHIEKDKTPLKPTFGAKLSGFRDQPSIIKGLFKFLGAMIKTMRQMLDYTFFLKNLEYDYLICKIDADEQFNWLDFNIELEDEVRLFNLGAKKALEFLNKFKWEIYKQARERNDFESLKKSVNKPT